jgi:hypothetical protein
VARHDSTRWVTVTRDNNSRAEQRNGEQLFFRSERRLSRATLLAHKKREGSGGEGRGLTAARGGQVPGNATTFTQRLLLVLSKLVYPLYPFNHRAPLLIFDIEPPTASS